MSDRSATEWTQATWNPVVVSDGDCLTIYQDQDSKLWARFTDEFNDGRFQPVDQTEGA